jgi:hypothetical protein
MGDPEYQTLAGSWSSGDIRLRRELGLLPDDITYQAGLLNRIHDNRNHRSIPQLEKKNALLPGGSGPPTRGPRNGRSLPGVDRAVGEGDQMIPLADKDQIGYRLVRNRGKGQTLPLLRQFVCSSY